jgi:hypothetical protein
LPSLDSSIKDVYNSVVKAEYRKLEIENYLLQNLSFDSQIETLYTDYKNYYSEDQRKKICLFEHHFSKSLLYIQTESYENIIHQRRTFLESLRNCYELQSSFIKCAKDAIIER